MAGNELADSILSLLTMDPAYGDGKDGRCGMMMDISVSTDLWAAGFSDDDEDQQRRDGNSDLDLLASLVEDRGEGGGRGGEGGDGGRGGEGGEGGTATQQKVVTTFEECLVKPDEVALMKGKHTSKLLYDYRERIHYPPQPRWRTWRESCNVSDSRWPAPLMERGHTHNVTHSRC